jgi:hypothetical protein
MQKTLRQCEKLIKTLMAMTYQTIAHQTISMYFMKCLEEIDLMVSENSFRIEPIIYSKMNDQSSSDPLENDVCYLSWKERVPSGAYIEVDHMFHVHWRWLDMVLNKLFYKTIKFQNIKVSRGGPVVSDCDIISNWNDDWILKYDMDLNHNKVDILTFSADLKDHMKRMWIHDDASRIARWVSKPTSERSVTIYWLVALPYGGHMRIEIVVAGTGGMTSLLEKSIEETLTHCLDIKHKHVLFNDNSCLEFAERYYCDHEYE